MPDIKKFKRPDTPLAATPEPNNFKSFAERSAKSDSIVATNRYLKNRPNLTEAKSAGNAAANQTRKNMGQADLEVIKSKDKYGQDKYTRKK